MDLTAQIVAEIQRAFLRLGGDMKDFPEVAVPGAFYQVFRDLKADRYLLGTIGSWGDTQTDEETLYSLQRLNAGSPFFRSDNCLDERITKKSPEQKAPGGMRAQCCFGSLRPAYPASAQVPLLTRSSRRRSIRSLFD